MERYYQGAGEALLCGAEPGADPGGGLVETVEKAGNTGMFLSPREALSLITDRSLLIIVDTHSESFVESRDLYKYSKRTVVIDHHRMMVKHIENAIIFYHEPYASSASEMVTELVQYLGENAIGRLELTPCLPALPWILRILC